MGQAVWKEKEASRGGFRGNRMSGKNMLAEQGPRPKVEVFTGPLSYAGRFLVFVLPVECKDPCLCKIFNVWP